MNEAIQPGGNAAIPQPFSEASWPKSLRDDARALWDWHLALTRPDVPALDGSDLLAFLEAERSRAEEGKPLRIVPESEAQAAYRVCEKHLISRTHLGSQIVGSRVFAEPARFDTAAALHTFIGSWAVAHGTALAGLAGAAHSWQLPFVGRLATGFFLTGRILNLPTDMKQDRLFIPLADLEQHRVSEDRLRQGEVDESVRKLLWKQLVRARDAFAQGLPLAREVSPRTGRTVKKWVLGALEVLNEVERRDYDVWSKPVILRADQRFLVALQSRFGRVTFRKR